MNVSEMAKTQLAEAKQEILDQLAKINTLQERLDTVTASLDESLEASVDIRDDRDTLRDRFTAPIVCICGSTRFKQTWISETRRLSLAGNIVLSVALWGHHEHVPIDGLIKEGQERLHKCKIDLCDWVWVIDVGAYIGESTSSEIAYAKKLGKKVRFLSQEFPGYKEPLDEVAEERDMLRKENEELRIILGCASDLIRRLASADGNIAWEALKEERAFRERVAVRCVSPRKVM
jgi:regulator of replication initiation timing